MKSKDNTKSVQRALDPYPPGLEPDPDIEWYTESGNNVVFKCPIFKCTLSIKSCLYRRKYKSCKIKQGCGTINDIISKIHRGE